MARGRPRKQEADGDGAATAQAATAGHEAELWREAETLIKDRYHPVLLRLYRTLDATRAP